MSIKPPADPTKHSVLTADVINETEATFKTFANKDGLVSQLDVVALVRSMGMNPTDGELMELVDALQIRDPVREKQERLERDEREKKERELREKEKAEALLQADKKGGKAPAGKTAKGKGKEDAEKYIWVPPERRPVVDWNKFITNIEPFFKDNRIEEDEILRALRVFDKEGKGWLYRDELVRIMCSKGEDILAPPEVQALLETFPHHKVELREFAQKIQGTWVEPLEPVELTSGRTQGPPASQMESTVKGDAITARTDPMADSQSVGGSVVSGSIAQQST